MPAASTFSRSSSSSCVRSSVCAELLLDRLELLAEVVLALALADLGLDLRLDLRPERQDLGFLGQHRDQARQARLDVGRLQQLLLGLGRQRGQRRRDEVAEPIGLGDVLHDGRQLVRQHRRQLDHLPEEVHRVPREGLRLEVAGRRRELGLFRDPGYEVRAHLRQLDDTDPVQTLDDQPHRPVRLLEDLVYGGERPDPMQIRLLRLLRRGVPLGEDADQAVPPDHVFEQADRRLSPRAERQGGLREQHGVTQRQDRNLVGNRSTRVPRIGARGEHLVVCHGDGLPFRQKRSTGESWLEAARTSASPLPRRASSRTSAMSPRT